MGVAEVKIDDEVIMTTRNTSVSPEVLKRGFTALDKYGEVIEGEAEDFAKTCFTAYYEDNKLTSASWAIRTRKGEEVVWSGTEEIRGETRVGDFYLITGKATNTGFSYAVVYKSTTDSGNLRGICLGSISAITILELNDFDDVDINEPQDGQVIAYSEASDKWENKTVLTKAEVEEDNLLLKFK